MSEKADKKAETQSDASKTNATHIKTRKAAIIGAVALVVLAGTGAAAYYFTNIGKPAAAAAADTGAKTQPITLAQMKEQLDVQTIYHGVTINGIDVSGKTMEEAAAMFADDVSVNDPEFNITLSVDKMEYPLNPSIFIISSNLPEVIESAYNYNRTSTETDESAAITQRYQTLEQLAKTTENFDIEYQTDSTAIDAAVRDILDPLETEPVNAVATSFDTQKLAFVIEDYRAGLDIDVDSAVKAVEAAVDAKEYTKTIIVDVKVTEPEVSKKDLEDILGLVSAFTTKTTDKPNRNSNIDLVCKTIDGLVLQPGEYFNFNEYIGQRTSAKGYKEAVGIYGGTTRLELGGGICQTTGTLFHSVMMADLQVDERHPHTWPSDYVETGTDATVTWGGKNFQFTNNTEYPIAIHAYYNDRHVTMEIYGRPVEDGMTIEIEGVTTGRSGPGAPVYIANPSAPAGSKSTTKSAHDYISAECYKVYYKDGVEVKRVLAYKSIYPSIRAEVSVGVLAPDGTIAAMNPSTGEVSGSAAVPTVPPAAETSPAATEPAATEPAATGPSVTEPAVTEPSATEPAATETTVV